jgi:excisionase family DNA binding protein
MSAHGRPSVESLLTINQTAATLGIARSSVYRLLRDGQLNAVRVGERVRIEPHAIREYLTRHRLVVGRDA